MYMLVFDPTGKVSRYESRKDVRDQVRKLRQGTREKVIRKAELTLKRIVSAAVAGDVQSLVMN